MHEHEIFVNHALYLWRVDPTKQAVEGVLNIVEVAGVLCMGRSLMFMGEGLIFMGEGLMFKYPRERLTCQFLPQPLKPRRKPEKSVFFIT